jgi:Ca2+-binding EF-hand superfamily protein
MLSLSQSRIRHFRRLLEISGLCHLEAETACNEILGKSRSKLSKADFLTAMQTLMNRNKPKLDVAAERALTDMLSGIYAAFDRDGKGQASAIEVACGFTVLCRGKKSDKLEFAFEVLDKNKKGRLSRTDMTSYLQSFLTVLLSVAFSPALESDASDDSVGTLKGAPLERSNTTLHKAVKGGAEWASSLAFKDFDKSKKKGSAMSFDDFAEWYTSVGFGSIPWLELLDLQKWALTAETK